MEVRARNSEICRKEEQSYKKKKGDVKITKERREVKKKPQGTSSGSSGKKTQKKIRNVHNYETKISHKQLNFPPFTTVFENWIGTEARTLMD